MVPDPSGIRRVPIAHHHRMEPTMSHVIAFAIVMVIMGTMFTVAMMYCGRIIDDVNATLDRNDDTMGHHTDR